VPNQKTPTVASLDALPGDLRALAKSYRLSLIASNKSPRTIQVYLESIRLLGEFLERVGMPTDIEALSREHVESFVADQLDRWKPTTASVRYRALQAFFTWLVAEDEIPVSPMLKMKPPKLDDIPPEVLNEERIRALLAVCEGKDFVSRRDTAIVRMLLDTGLRREEMASLTLEMIDWDLCVVRIVGKGRKGRSVPFGKKAATALDRYIRLRAKHRDADDPHVWLGKAGPMTGNGIYQIVRERAIEAKVGRVYTHLFRHLASHNFLAAGGQEGDLMVINGWASSEMARRYGKSAAAERAIAAYKRLSPGDKY
jgi:site-specific recombinase XerD